MVGQSSVALVVGTSIGTCTLRHGQTKIPSTICTGMRVLTVIFTFTMAFGIPLPSGCGKLTTNRVPPEDCQKDNYGFQVNVTRSADGDTIQSYCRQCSELCIYANSVRLRCDIHETPCVCQCRPGQTFRTDIVKCVETFTGKSIHNNSSHEVYILCLLAFTNVKSF